MKHDRVPKVPRAEAVDEGVVAAAADPEEEADEAVEAAAVVPADLKAGVDGEAAKVFDFNCFDNTHLFYLPNRYGNRYLTITDYRLSPFRRLFCFFGIARSVTDRAASNSKPH